MAGVATILVMSTLLGAAAFGVGMLPLFFSFSSSRIAYLSTLGTGLLLGAALGVIIPEGIEAVISETNGAEVPTQKIALSLLAGFAFMLLVEQFVHGHDREGPEPSQHIRLRATSLSEEQPLKDDTRRGSEEETDSLDELEHQVLGSELGNVRGEDKNAAGRAKAFSLTLGLVIHSLADGLALGASAAPGRSESNSAESSSSSQLSLVVFMALIIHKAPTALALSMSLLSMSLSRAEFKKHISAFSAATPLGALASFTALKLIGQTSDNSWTGIAMLISGGTFLYVATVLQPGSQHDGPASSTPEINEKIRIALVIVGMFIPVAIGSVTGHDHGGFRSPNFYTVIDAQLAEN